MDDTKILGIAIVVVFGAIFGGTYLIDNFKCYQLSKVSGKDTQYRLFSGCFVEVNGRFIPQGNWRGEYEQ